MVMTFAIICNPKPLALALILPSSLLSKLNLLPYHTVASNRCTNLPFIFCSIGLAVQDCVPELLPTLITETFSGLSL